MDLEELTKNCIEDGYSPNPDDADKFVSTPFDRKCIDYYVIHRELSTASGLRELPVRLVNGKHFGSGGGYGVSHILYHHGSAIALFGYYSVQDFVADVFEGFKAVYAGRDKRNLILKGKTDDLAVDRLLVIELANSLDYYSVVTGWTVSSRRPANGELIAELTNKEGTMVWECRAPH